MHILFAASEAVPFIKTGGLADVVGELPQYLVKSGNKVSVVLPKYKSINSELLEGSKLVKYFDVYMNNAKLYAGIIHLFKDGINYYFVDNESFFYRDQIYGYDDDDSRFGFFCLSIMEMISHLKLDVDVIHANDWQTGPLAMLYYERYHQYPYYENIKWVFTIHNPAYQGLFDKNVVSRIFGLDMNLYHNGTLRFKDAFSFLKVGIVYANKITTVSPTHAKELLEPEYAHGLENVIRLRSHDLVGILNGIDYKKYNPLTDSKIGVNYRNSYRKKLLNKKALQEQCHFKVDENIPLVAIVSRLTWQKGIDLIVPNIENLINKGIQLIVLGSGDKQYEDDLRYFANKFPQSVYAYIGFSDELAHQIYAGTDILLMPSLFEPCGISQMIALRYGAIPLVRETGGLSDTVIPYNEYTGEGNGFSFRNFDYKDLSIVLDYALKQYNNKDVWNLLFKNALKSNYSWNQSSKKYLELYKSL